MQIEKVFVFDHGDGISFDRQEDANWSITGVHVKYSRDDCVENDFLNSGTIDADQIRRYLHATPQFEGALGLFSFDQNGDPLLPFDVRLVDNGTLVVVN